MVGFIISDQKMRTSFFLCTHLSPAVCPLRLSQISSSLFASQTEDLLFLTSVSLRLLNKLIIQRYINVTLC